MAGKVGQAADLATYDIILVNSSAGKDSQTMLDVVVEQARELGILERVVVVHCDLGRMEWAGTRELAEEQARHYGLRFEVVSRPQGDILTQVRGRGMWPSSTARYCTSDHKRGQVGTLMTQLAKEHREAGNTGPCRILNCLGIRAAESRARSKKQAFSHDRRMTNGRRHVDTFYPIFDWSEAEVWERIAAAGTRHHRAYDLGMPRLSCCFCIFSPRPALLLAGHHNVELLREYVEVEREIEHTFRKDLTLVDILEAVEAGEEPGEIKTWEM